jgi:hypothetical protein
MIDWLADREAGVVRDDRELLELHAYSVIGAIKLQELRSTDIDRLLTNLRNKVSTLTKRKLAATTQHHCFSVVKAALNAAVRRQLISVNPCAKAEIVPEADPKAGIALDEGELAAGFRGTRLYPFVALAAASGCRRLLGATGTWTYAGRRRLLPLPTTSVGSPPSSASWTSGFTTCDTPTLATCSIAASAFTGPHKGSATVPKSC